MKGTKLKRNWERLNLKMKLRAIQVHSLIYLLLASQYDVVSGKSQSKASMGMKAVSPNAWTPEIFQELLLTEHKQRENNISRCASEKNVLVSRPRSVYVPFTIETNENEESFIQMDQSCARNIKSMKASNAAQSFSSIIKKRLRSRLVLASEIVKRGKDLISKSTHFAVTSAKHRSLGAMLLSDCYALYAKDEDALYAKGDQYYHLGNGYKTMLEKSRYLVEYNPLKAMERGRKSNSSPDQSGSGFAPTGILTMNERDELVKRTEVLTENVLHALRNGNIWEEVNQEDGVFIWRSLVDVKNYHPHHNPNPDKDPDSATIRSEFILNASPQKVFTLFSDDNRVHEYNENCHKLEDLELLSENCKINWSATGKFGPFSARDFVTLVSFQNLGPTKGYLSLCASVEHSKLAPEKNGYVRSQIQLAATFMEPVEGHPDQTRFTQVMQVGRLGGVADSPFAKRIKANLQEKAPIEFFHKFREALKNTPDTSHKELNVEV